jgi:anti-sigma factor RsiW
MLLLSGRLNLKDTAGRGMAGKEPEMYGKKNKPGEPLACDGCREGLQEYLDGTLEKPESLRFFLHLRDCLDCQKEHDRLEGMFQMLESLPDHEVPADFDFAVLASVPYAAYQAMEPLRRERVPVFLEEAFLPRFVRSRVTRLAGLGLSAVSATLIATGDGTSLLPVLMVTGLVPEILVRLQGLGRRALGSVGRAES